MSYWLTDPELFLYVKGIGPDEVHLWRCKKPASSSSSSSLEVSMKPDDFDYVSNVKNHMELIGNFFYWDETDYKRLVKYIFENGVLVNSHGYVITELYKIDKDGNKMIDNASKIYIRSLEILPLEPYIPKFNKPSIPLRKVKFSGDVNGKAAMMEEDSNVTKLTARVADLESKNKTLAINVTKLTAGLDTTTGNVSDLQSKNKTLEGKVTKLIADLVTLMNELPTKVWMNEITSSEWVGVEGLRVYGPHDDFIIVGPLGTFTVDDSSTNVRARYWYKIKASAMGRSDYQAVFVGDLTPNKEMARFSPDKWSSFKSKGKTYVFRNI